MAAKTCSDITIFLSLILLLPLTLAISSGDVEGYIINGKVKFSGFSISGFGLPEKLSNVKVILNGGQGVTFLRSDGYFSFSSHNVPARTHLIEVATIGYFFSPVRIDVSARNPGKVQAALTENRRVLSELVLEPFKGRTVLRDKRTILHNVYREEPNGSDGQICGNCDVYNTQTSW